MSETPTPPFADTSYFLALLIPNDEYHLQSVAFAQSWSGPIITSEFVLPETANHLGARRTKPVYVEFFAAITSDDRMTILPATQDWMRQGYHLYRERLDKDWSLTDCISFEMMRQYQLTDALTADYHFEQAGFNGLLR